MSGDRNIPATVCGVCGAATDAYLDRTCMAKLERAIAEMPALLAELTVTETGQAKVYRSSRRVAQEPETVDAERVIPARLRSRDPRVALPATGIRLNEDAAEVREIVTGTLGAWARHLAETRGIEGPNDRSLFGWLLTNVGAFAYDEAGAVAFDEITYAHHRLERTVDSAPSRTFWGRCDAETVEPVEVDGVITVEAGECGRDLYAKADAGTIVCDGHRGDGHGCGATRATEDVRASLRELTEDALVTIDEVQFASRQLFGEDKRLPSAACWRTWANRGQIKAHGKNRQGEPLYRGADIIEKIETFSPRSGRRSA